MNPVGFKFLRWGHEEQDKADSQDEARKEKYRQGYTHNHVQGSHIHGPHDSDPAKLSQTHEIREQGYGIPYVGYGQMAGSDQEACLHDM